MNKSTTTIINIALAALLLFLSHGYFQYAPDKGWFGLIVPTILLIGGLWMLVKTFLLYWKSYGNEDKLTNSSAPATSAQKTFIAEGMRSLGVYWKAPKLLTKKQARAQIRKINAALGRNITIIGGTNKRDPNMTSDKLQNLEFYDQNENFSWKSYVNLSIVWPLFALLMGGITFFPTIDQFAKGTATTQNAPLFAWVVLVVVMIIAAIAVIWGAVSVFKAVCKIWTSDWNDDGIYDEGLPATKEQIDLIIAGMRSQGEYISDDKVKRLNRASAVELINQINDRMFKENHNNSHFLLKNRDFPKTP